VDMPNEPASGQAPVEGEATPEISQETATSDEVKPVRRRGRRLLVGALGIAVLLFIGFVGVSFLGAQVKEALAGQVVFGTQQPDSNCLIADSDTTFAEGVSLYWAAHFHESLPAGTTLVIEFGADGQTAGTREYTTSTDDTDCIAVAESTGPLSAGEYSIRVHRDADVQAEGSVTVE
jgi:hypothetical protein